MIERFVGNAPKGRCVSSASGNLVWSVATATDEFLEIADQTKQALENLDNNLSALGADKKSIISAQVYMANIEDKAVMDGVWNTWIGDDPRHWPQRACLGVDLGGHWLIEVTVTAVRQT